MNVKGKFYLLVNIGAYLEPHFVAAEPTGARVQVMTNPEKAAFFDTCEQAQDRQKTADAVLPYEIILCRATRDILPTNKAKILRPPEA